MNQLIAARIDRRVALVTSLALVGGGLTACAVTATQSSTQPTMTVVDASSTTFWDTSTVHTISIDLADADYRALITNNDFAALYASAKTDLTASLIAADVVDSDAASIESYLN